MRILAFLMLALSASASVAQPLVTSEPAIELGRIVGAGDVEGSFKVTNPGPEPVRIRNVQLTPPLSVTRMKAVVAPGATEEIAFRLGSPRPAGNYEGAISINFEGDETSLVLDVNATLVPPIEFVPRRELRSVTERNVEARDSIEIVSHLEQPLEISGDQLSSERFATTLETLEPGRRYRLSLVLTGKGAAGKQSDTVTLKTSSPEYAELKIPVRTSLKERVYTFPDTVDLGRIALAPAKEAEPNETSVMVYQKDGQDFQIKVSTDVPFLVLRPEKSTKFGDRWQIFCSVEPGGASAGPVRGSLFIETNDSKFPKLTVPVTGIVQ